MQNYFNDREHGVSGKECTEKFNDFKEYFFNVSHSFPVIFVVKTFS